MNILGIETSCDETAASLLIIKGGFVNVKTNVVSSQIKIHKKYGGIVPEVAARNHVPQIIPVMKKAIGKNKIDAIAVTSGPGLATSLLVGVQAALTLSYADNIPLIPVNHIEAHLLANWLPNTKSGKIKNVSLPAIGLIVSGGHTQLVLIKKIGKYQIIGQTLDDAAGEAFDKVAKMLDLEYPGGPIISKLAINGDPNKFNFPRPMLKADNFDFSFSGLKTSVLYKIRDMDFKDNRPKSSKSRKKPYYGKNTKLISDVCASFQQAAVDVLVAKTLNAAKEYKVKSVMLAGGVSANKLLRETLNLKIDNDLPKVKYLAPPLYATTDNAVMIALAGYFMQKNKKFPSALKNRIRVNPNLSL